MKTIQEVSSDKRRGGFYTPDSLADRCLDRVAHLCAERSNLAVLEPSVGDGAFVRRLAAHPLANHIATFVGLEVNPCEAQKCRDVAHDAPFPSTILTRSALEWETTTEQRFDIVLGNPPFVRYQFMTSDDVRATAELGRHMDVPFRGVTNLWVPLLLGALNRLHLGGVMAVVVPAEIFTGLATGTARAWLTANFSTLQVDLFAPGSFPGVLQEVVIISGQRTAFIDEQIVSQPIMKFVEHSGTNIIVRWSHQVPLGTRNWTRYMLTPTQLDALLEVQNLPLMQRIGDIAKFEVSAVTGANDFFSVDNEELTRFHLQPWAQPLLARIRYAEELVYTQKDHDNKVATGAKAWLLNFSAEHPDPHAAEGPAHYLELGKQRGLAKRYKTSIRNLWYRVPGIWPCKLMMSKRSHRFPRLVYNDADVVTTDTIYRGRMLPFYEGRELDLVAGFHNSITLLTAELNGRSFGGGVLELVPSEVAGLMIPFPVDLRGNLPKLRSIARESMVNPERQEWLVEETDTLLAPHVQGLTPKLMHQIQQARKSLLTRRLSRN